MFNSKFHTSHIELSDGTRYIVLRHRGGNEQLIRDPRKVSGRERKRLRKRYKMPYGKIMQSNLPIN